MAQANYAKPLRMEDSPRLRVWVSTLHHQFRALTAMSPLQYQKHLRLRVARERMLRDGIDATSAAYEVGYESEQASSIASTAGSLARHRCANQGVL